MATPTTGAAACLSGPPGSFPYRDRRSPDAVRLSAAAARRVAIAAQGLAAPRPAAPGMRQLTAAVDRMGLLQMDSVNVLVRSHYLPLFSRLGPTTAALLDRAGRRARAGWWSTGRTRQAWSRPRPTGCCAGGCSRWREEAWGSMQRVAAEHPELVSAVLAEVADRTGR